MTVAIVYKSRKGTTKKMAENMKTAYEQNGHQVVVCESVDNADKAVVVNADVVCLGCWTHGLMLFLQHPEKVWVDYVQSLPSLTGKKVVLFATYKLATGVMFKKMAMALDSKGADIIGACKSKFGKLNDDFYSLLN
jgi:flavodoxin